MHTSMRTVLQSIAPDRQYFPEISSKTQYSFEVSVYAVVSVHRVLCLSSRRSHVESGQWSLTRSATHDRLASPQAASYSIKPN